MGVLHKQEDFEITQQFLSLRRLIFSLKVYLLGARQSMTIEASFAPLLFSKDKTAEHKNAYLQSKPYRHAVIDGLIDDALLQRARQEILDELRFTEKETDIYKVNQTGDLANLDGLPIEESKRLQNLLQLRNAIYSDQFRKWLQNVTGCGPLSAKKKDMSINDYTSGCHLLNHE